MSRDPFAINHFLRSNGLASLNEAGALMAQLGFLVRDDQHFKQLLMTCPKEDRGHMYNALAPNLQFKARPLHVYEIETAAAAEARQLPTIGEDGKFKPYRVVEVTTEPAQSEASQEVNARLNELVTEEIAKEHLAVVCGKCTREGVFHGMTKEDAIEQLAKAGWKIGLNGENQPIEICPECEAKYARRALN